jgi:hypothetical protein
MGYLQGRQYSEGIKAVRIPHSSTPVHLLPEGISCRVFDYSIITKFAISVKLMSDIIFVGLLC